MSNPISPEIKTGTIGELLVQFRLLQYGVQAAPPLKDSGNDLIAVKGEVFKSIQIKTTTGSTFTKPDHTRLYHLLAVVELSGKENRIDLDESKIFIVPKNEVQDIPADTERLDPYVMDQKRVDALFCP